MRWTTTPAALVALLWTMLVPMAAWGMDEPAGWDPLRSGRRATGPGPSVDKPYPEPGIASAPGANGLIAFNFATYSLNLDQPAAVWTVNEDGSMPQQLTSSTVGLGDQYPAWSPGGTLIAFTRDTTTSTLDDAGDLWVMASDGGGSTRITATAAAEYSPAWSPDGSRLAFASDRAGSSNFDVYTMKVDGTDVRRITSHASGDFDPTWSPDGTRIAFVSLRDGNPEIYSVEADGGGLRRLTNSGAADVTPDWSPDGARIAFASDRGSGDYFDIYTISATGGSLATVTADASSNEFGPAWSPDGQRILYTGDYYGDFDIYSVGASGGDPSLVTVSYDDEFNAHWQPIPEFPLVDARFSTFEEHIVWAYLTGITSGCTLERYCASDAVTRGQMASFLSRALDLPPTNEDFFTDDETSTHEIAINRVAAAGIASGCTPTTFCPKGIVTRGQMAAFLHRALGD